MFKYAKINDVKKDILKIASDNSHWIQCEPPLAPNKHEVEIYKKLIGNKCPVCLLGMTQSLIPYCDVAVDLFPLNVNVNIPVIQCDWNDLSGKYGAIIGDGVINLEGLQLVDKMLNICEVFVARVFTKKQPKMKYATIFPQVFPKSSTVITTQQDIVMVMWENLCKQ